MSLLRCYENRFCFRSVAVSREYVVGTDARWRELMDGWSVGFSARDKMGYGAHATRAHSPTWEAMTRNRRRYWEGRKAPDRKPSCAEDGREDESGFRWNG